LAVLMLAVVRTRASEWVVYEGTEGPGKGRHVVLVSGDEEYRSEEALPCLGRILAEHHGFKCTVLFAISDGYIDPNNRHNIPGLQALETADLMIIATRFRDLPDEQMKYIDDYLKAGKPVIGLRTATHAFSIPEGKPYAHYSQGYKGEKERWTDGFGRLVLGETWVNHHGAHRHEATRGVIPAAVADNPIVNGCEDIFGPSDVYSVRLPLPGDSEPVVLGAVLEGMQPADRPVQGGKNDPMMPVAWTRTYRTESGCSGRVFTTTMGASVDLVSEGLRRLLVNAAYWCVGLEADIPRRAKVEIAGEFKPSFYGSMREEGYWKKKGLRPDDFAAP